MATLTATGPGVYALGAAQTGNVDTDILDRGKQRGAAAVVIANVDGGSGTVKADIKGSADGVNYFNVPYALVATPSTFVVSQLTITTAATTTYLLQTAQPWRWLKVAFTANTSETLTTTATL